MSEHKSPHNPKSLSYSGLGRQLRLLSLKNDNDSHRTPVIDEGVGDIAAKVQSVRSTLW